MDQYCRCIFAIRSLKSQRCGISSSFVNFSINFSLSKLNNMYITTQARRNIKGQWGYARDMSPLQFANKYVIISTAKNNDGS